jgi:hypothetical protein
MAYTHFSGVSTPLLQVGGVQVPTPSQQAAILDYTITWTGNEPTAADTQTIVDGDDPTVVETGQAIADLTAKLNLALAALRANGLIA